MLEHENPRSQQPTQPVPEQRNRRTHEPPCPQSPRTDPRNRDIHRTRIKLCAEMIAPALPSDWDGCPAERESAYVVEGSDGMSRLNLVRVQQADELLLLLIEVQSSIYTQVAEVGNVR